MADFSLWNRFKAAVLPKQEVSQTQLQQANPILAETRSAQPPKPPARPAPPPFPSDEQVLEALKLQVEKHPEATHMLDLQQGSRMGGAIWYSAEQDLKAAIRRNRNGDLNELAEQVFLKSALSMERETFKNCESAFGNSRAMRYLGDSNHYGPEEIGAARAVSEIAFAYSRDGTAIHDLDAKAAIEVLDAAPYDHHFSENVMAMSKAFAQATSGLAIEQKREIYEFTKVVYWDIDQRAVHFTPVIAALAAGHVRAGQERHISSEDVQFVLHTMRFAHTNPDRDGGAEMRALKGFMALVDLGQPIARYNFLQTIQDGLRSFVDRAEFAETPEDRAALYNDIIGVGVGLNVDSAVELVNPFDGQQPEAGNAVEASLR